MKFQIFLISIVILLCLTFVSADVGKDALPKLDLEINGASISIEDNKIKSVSVTITNHGPSILKNDLVQINFCIKPEDGYQVTGCSTKFVDLRERYCVQSGNVTCVMGQGDVSTFTLTDTKSLEFFNSHLKPGKYIMDFGIGQLNGLKNYEEINKDNNRYNSTFKIESKPILKPPETIQPEVKEAQPQQTLKPTTQTPKPTSNKFLLNIIIGLVIIVIILSIFLFSKRRVQTKKTKCRHCGAKLGRAETFCPKCGKGQTSGLINFFKPTKAKLKAPLILLLFPFLLYLIAYLINAPSLIIGLYLIYFLGIPPIAPILDRLGLLAPDIDLTSMGEIILIIFFYAIVLYFISCLVIHICPQKSWKRLGLGLLIFFITYICLFFVSAVVSQSHFICKVSLEENKCYANVAGATKDVSICKKIIGPFRKNSCYTIVARETKDISLCEKVTDISSMKNECYHTVAIETKDTSLCEKITDSFKKNRCYSAVVRATKKTSLSEK